MRTRVFTATITIVALTVMLAPARAWAYSSTQTQTTTRVGQTFTFTFSGLPAAFTAPSVRLDLYGDYDASNEFADVAIDAVGYPRHDGNVLCNTTASSKTYTARTSDVTDGRLIIQVANTGAVEAAECAPRNPRVSVTVSYTEVAARPDLEVSSVVAPVTGSTARAGSAFTVRTVVNNASSRSFTTDFAIDYLFCPSTSTTGCGLMNRQTVTDNFAGGQTRTYTSPTLRVANNAVRGTRYVRVRVDAASAIAELDERNNDRSAGVPVTTFPDLAFTAHRVPSAGSVSIRGSKFNAQFTLRNAPSTSAFTTDFDIGYQFCNAPSSGCTTLGSAQRITTNFNAAATSVITSPQLTIPTTATLGTRYICASADSGRRVTESNESNNTRCAPVTIQSNAPNLQVSTLSVSPRTSGPGGTLTVTYRLFNAGPKPTTGAFKTRFYYSSNSSITPLDPYLSKEVSVTSLASRASFPSSGNGTVTVILPKSLGLGTSYIGAIVDYDNKVVEDDERDNTRAASFTVAKPDIGVASWTTPTTAVGAGTSIPITYSIGNLGTVASGPCRVTFYYGASIASTGLTELKFEAVPSVAPSKVTTPKTINVTLPNTVVAGTGYLHTFVDSKLEVDEASETNNRDVEPIALSGKPNLTVSLLRLRPTTQGAGGAVNVRYRVANGGLTSASNAFTLRFYFSTDATIDSTDTYLAKEVALKSLDARSSSPAKTHGSVLLTLPGSTTTGAGYIGAIVDPTDVIAEETETDNTASAKITVTSTITDAGLADGWLTDAGTSPYDAGRDASSDAATGEGGVASDGGTASDGGKVGDGTKAGDGPASGPPDEGCDCGVASDDAPEQWLLGLLALALGVGFRRRRR